MSTIQNFLTTGEFGTPYDCIPFNDVKTEDFVPLIEKSIELARANIAKIKASPANFQNTIMGLEDASDRMEIFTGIYFNLFSAHATPELQALAQKISGITAAFSSEVNLDDQLFQKVREVHARKDSLGLNPEQLRLLEKLYKGFARNGALLPADKKQKLKDMDQEMAGLSPQFSENVLNATNDYSLTIEDKKELEGMPDAVVEAAAEEAKKRGKTGWTFTLQAPSLMPFLKYCKVSSRRKELWHAYASRAFKDKYDNQEMVLKTARLRHERARLLGYETHAHYVLEERMARTPATVEKFLDSLLEPSRKAAAKDVADLRDFRKRKEGNDEINPWDFAYYSEKLREESFNLSEEELRPYFQLENCVAGVFEMAKRLYGLKFKKLTNVPVYHPEVEAYEVTSDENGELIGLFYMDFFPRDTKRGGAWMTAFRDQGEFGGKVRRPHVAIVCNFTKPTASKPSLLTFDEVETLFHEFGHALHALLSRCTYRSLSGTNVYWDFVELPSQIMENWLHETEGLQLFAKHYHTGEPIPAELIKKIQRADLFQAGWASLRQLSFGILDMAWHAHDPAAITDVSAFEIKSMEPTRIFPVVPGTNASCSFSHIFAGGYSAGYYSYKWAEVLDADAFEYFREKGLFNKEVAHKFRDFILSKGDTQHPAELYRKFRGRDPDPKALLRRSGFEGTANHA